MYSSKLGADLVGHIGYNSFGMEIFNFGKHKGEIVVEVFQKEPSYYDWMMKADFPLSTKQVITRLWEREKEIKMEMLKYHFGSR